MVKLDHTSMAPIEAPFAELETAITNKEFEKARGGAT